MANFKVGQRVRVIAVHQDVVKREDHLIGREGCITAYCPDYVRHGRWLPWEVRLDGGLLCGFAAHHLAPLTDPKADEFIERIKNLKPYEEPLVPSFGNVLIHEGK